MRGTKELTDRQKPEAGNNMHDIAIKNTLKEAKSVLPIAEQTV